MILWCLQVSRIGDEKIWRILSLPLLQVPLLPEVIVSVRISYMDHIDVFYFLYSIGLRTKQNLSKSNTENVYINVYKFNTISKSCDIK